MNPWLRREVIGNSLLYVGDCRSVLPALESGSVNCCVTSPPYWGLRDYGTAKWKDGDMECDHLAPKAGGTGPASAVQVQGKRVDFESGGQFRNVCKKCGAHRIDNQIGLEPTPQEYVEKMVAVFREVRRVLRDDGTLWLNLGDSYASGGRKSGDPGQSKIHPAFEGEAYSDGLRPDDPPGIKPKDLIGIPWRVALALQADGWYLRQDIIWAKPNPMPESVRDRCTKSHEYLFLLSKNERYFYDADAIMEPFATDPSENYPARARITGRGEQSAAEARGNDRDKSGGFPPRSYRGSTFTNGKTGAVKPTVGQGERVEAAGRNKRSVWTVATQPYSEAHFATFPPALIEPCVLAGCPPGGVVLDPFGGSGTTGQVAENLGRNWILIELNEDYARLCADRTRQAGMVFPDEPQAKPEQLAL